MNDLLQKLDYDREQKGRSRPNPKSKPKASNKKLSIAKSDSDTDSDSDSDYESLIQSSSTTNSDSYDLIKDALYTINNGGDNDTVAVLLYVYQPWCPYCKEFMPTWNSQTNLLHNLMDGLQTFKIEADNINHDDSLIPPKNTVPQILLFTYNPDLGSSVSKDLSDPSIRQNLAQNVEKSLDETNTKIKKRKPQSGKGIVESIVTASVLGGVAISSTKIPQVKQVSKTIENISNLTKKSILKKSGKNLLKSSISSATKSLNAQSYADATTNAIKGLSKTTSDILQGKIKKLSGKDLMKVYKTFKSNKKSSKSTRKTRKTYK